MAGDARRLNGGRRLADEFAGVPGDRAECIEERLLVRDPEEDVVEAVPLRLPALQVRDELADLDRAGELVADPLEGRRGEEVGLRDTREEPEPELPAETVEVARRGHLRMIRSVDE